MKQPKRHIWARLQDFAYAHKKLSVTLAICMVVVGAAAIAGAWFLVPQKKVAAPVANVPQSQPTTQPTPQKFYSPLTGQQVANQATTKREVTAVMIENSPSARPQSGIKDAGVVFEAIAEGGITRFATLHQEDRPGIIGPVRSLRPYYIDWIAPFDASIAHVGGSANALNTVRNGSFKDIDQFFNGNYYWRATDRAAPHNVYTNFDKLDALNQSKGYTSSTFTGFARKAEHPVGTPNATKIDIPVSSGDYNVHYDYDKASNTYNRSEGGAPHKDREGGQIAPKVVVVLKVPTQLGFEDGYREQMTTTGTNQAYVFQDGTVIDGFWHKTDQKSQMVFYDKNAHQIAFNPGQTWITVVAPEKNITWQ